MQLGDARDDGHAEPHAVPLLGVDPEEALAQPRQGGGGDAGAVVPHIHPDPVALLADHHGDLATRLGVAQRIVDEVAEHQVQQHGLPHHLQMLAPLQGELLILLQGDGGQGGQGALQQGDQGEGGERRRLLVVDAGLGQQLADQAIAAIQGQEHLAQRLFATRLVFGRHGILAVDTQHRQRGA